MHLKKFFAFSPILGLNEIAFAYFFHQNEPGGYFFKLSIGFFEITDTARLITHLVKFLRKLSEIKGDKNFLKRGEVDVIKFRPLIIILLIFKDFSKL